MNQQQLQHRLQEVEREKAALRQQLALQKYVASYPIQLEWPAVVINDSKDNTGNKTRTNHDLIQHRLLEAGILYDVPVAAADAVAAAGAFCDNMNESDCFYSVGVELGGTSSAEIGDSTHETNDTNGSSPLRTVQVKLHEKKWYRLHAGAGIKTNHLTTQINSNSVLPVAEFECSAGLRNLAGYMDRTDLHYSRDTHNIATWRLVHGRPLYTVMPSTISELMLSTLTGSQWQFSSQAALDTADHEFLSSYKLYQRLLSVTASTSRIPDPWHVSLEWAARYRDLVPRRHATLPYHFAASPAICAYAGASVTSTVKATVHYDDTVSDPGSGLPVSGLQVQCATEVAAPPGDVGYIKPTLNVGWHLPLVASTNDNGDISGTAIALHGSLATGYLQSLSHAGACQAVPGPMDRFLLGGVGSFRGFSPGGIGPRSGRDALGGNAFGVASLVLSVAPLGSTALPTFTALANHVRGFGFVTAGTCANHSFVRGPGVMDLLRSTRTSAGIGIATKSFGPRVEVTYSVPLRYSPRDSRRHFQFGISFLI